jgi:hypothetical protein
MDLRSSLPLTLLVLAVALISTGKIFWSKGGDNLNFSCYQNTDLA